MSPRAARVEGTLTRWDDDRGFGFITPTGGSSNVFAHISSFKPNFRPIPGDRVTFQHGIGKNGRPQALSIQAPGRPEHSSHGSRSSRLLVIPIFAGIYLALAFFWPIPVWVAAVYGGMSILTAIVYAIDKSSARSGGWRVSESSLLALGFLGGWPGAIVAQQLLRHKTVKESFRNQFWATVVVHIILFVVTVIVIGIGPTTILGL